MFRGVGVPSLVGAWDVFPMLTTGLAGFREEGGRAVPSDRVPLAGDDSIATAPRRTGMPPRSTLGRRTDLRRIS